jgi:hypothetical protein
MWISEKIMLYYDINEPTNIRININNGPNTTYNDLQNGPSQILTANILIDEKTNLKVGSQTGFFNLVPYPNIAPNTTWQSNYKAIFTLDKLQKSFINEVVTLTTEFTINTNNPDARFIPGQHYYGNLTSNINIKDGKFEVFVEPLLNTPNPGRRHVILEFSYFKC